MIFFLFRSIMARGKALYTSMNSSHNLSKALEKFISWLSESEATANGIEMEVDKMPPSSGTGRRDSVNPRAPYVRLKVRKKVHFFCRNRRFASKRNCIFGVNKTGGLITKSDSSKAKIV